MIYFIDEYEIFKKKNTKMNDEKKNNKIKTVANHKIDVFHLFVYLTVWVLQMDCVSWWVTWIKFADMNRCFSLLKFLNSVFLLLDILKQEYLAQSKSFITNFSFQLEISWSWMDGNCSEFELQVWWTFELFVRLNVSAIKLRFIVRDSETIFTKYYFKFIFWRLEWWVHLTTRTTVKIKCIIRCSN